MSLEIKVYVKLNNDVVEGANVVISTLLGAPVASETTDSHGVANFNLSLGGTYVAIGVDSVVSPSYAGTCLATTDPNGPVEVILELVAI